jgi:hypothetical protein
MFRGRFLHWSKKAFSAGTLNFFSAHRHLHEPAAFRRYLTAVWNTEWVVYAKRPFAGPWTVSSPRRQSPTTACCPSTTQGWVPLEGLSG